jgi:hypothetical protein
VEKQTQWILTGILLIGLIASDGALIASSLLRTDPFLVEVLIFAVGIPIAIAVRLVWVDWGHWRDSWTWWVEVEPEEGSLGPPCQHCGRPLPYAAKYCPECAAPVS